MPDEDDPLRLQALGLALSGARRARRLTQEALAGRVGMSAKALSEIERGRKNSRQLTILRLVAALDDKAREDEDAPAGASGLYSGYERELARLRRRAG